MLGVANCFALEKHTRRGQEFSAIPIGLSENQLKDGHQLSEQPGCKMEIVHSCPSIAVITCSTAENTNTI